MVANAAAENVLGTIGAVCWSVQLAPQVWKSWRTKNTAGLSSWMLSIWFVGGIFLGAYVVVQNINIPLIVQPQCFMALSAVCWAQCLYYDQGKSGKFAIMAASGACFLGAGIEAALIFGAKAAEKNGHTQVTQMTGIVSAVFIAGGLLPQYYEIYRFRAVIGISLVFLAVDLAGGVFSLLSLVFSTGDFDVLASLSYGVVVVLEVGVFILAPILNPAYERRKLAERQAQSSDLEGGGGQGDHTTTTTTTMCTRTRSRASESIVTLPELPPIHPSRSKVDGTEEEAAEVTRGRGRMTEVHRTPLGWLDDAVTPTISSEHGASSRRSSMERELSRDRLRLERTQPRTPPP